MKERFGWNLKEGPNVLFNWYKEMIFQLMKAIIVCSIFTCELWRLLFIPYVNIFRPPYSYLLLRDLCFLTGLELIHKKYVWIFSKALITWVGNDTIRASKTSWECLTFKGNYSSFRSKILRKILLFSCCIPAGTATL